MLFDQLKLLPADPILGLAPLYNSDPRQEKVNLGIGTYMDEKGYPIVFEAVKKAETLIDQEGLNKEYQPIDGSIPFKDAVLDLVFGQTLLNDPSKMIKERTAVAATIGGSGALRLAGDLLQAADIKKLALPSPTWSNHFGLLKNIAHLTSYPYYDLQTHQINFEAMRSSLETLPEHAFVLLHTCCQNPTGKDLTLEQWKELIALMKKKSLYPLFDFAYHGYKEGIQEDRAPIHMFIEQDFECLIAYSFSKSMTLYGERVGALINVSNAASSKEKAASHMKALIRQIYSSPPIHGTRIVPKVVFTKELRSQWENELSQVKTRVKQMRSLFVEKMGARYEYVLSENGLFSLVGLTENQVLDLRTRFGIYMPDNGRINFAGLNNHNSDYAFSSIQKVL